jgi:hypothetical protein
MTTGKWASIMALVLSCENPAPDDIQRVSRLHEKLVEEAMQSPQNLGSYLGRLSKSKLSQSDFWRLTRYPLRMNEHGFAYGIPLIHKVAQTCDIELVRAYLETLVKNKAAWVQHDGMSILSAAAVVAGFSAKSLNDPLPVRTFVQALNNSKMLNAFKARFLQTMAVELARATDAAKDARLQAYRQALDEATQIPPEIKNAALARIPALVG